MSSLRREPPMPVRSMEELFAIAHAMEEEAERRYTEIADRLGSDQPDLAAVFDRLASEERGHLDAVVSWSERHGTRSDPSLIRWTIPETFDDEGAGTADPRLMSAYGALAMAVRNEERAFAFWTYVVAHARDAEVRRAAEAMAAEELDHVATLRRERRRAYHAHPAVPSSGAEASAAELEAKLADRLDRMAERSGPRDASRLGRLAAETRATARELQAEPLPLRPGSESRTDVPDDAAALAEFLVDRYLEAAERLPDERSVSRAQALAGRAIARLAWVRADLPELNGPA